MTKQTFELKELPETYVAGLALRSNNRTEQELKEQGWIAKTWEEVRQMEGPNLPAAIYTGYAGDKDDNFTLVIGFQRESADDFKIGEVISKVPAGKYARFSHKGSLPNAAIEAWQAVWQAEEEGTLDRAYSADLEMHEGSNENINDLTVELYIAIK